MQFIPITSNHLLPYEVLRSGCLFFHCPIKSAKKKAPWPAAANKKHFGLGSLIVRDSLAKIDFLLACLFSFRKKF